MRHPGSAMDALEAPERATTWVEGDRREVGARIRRVRLMHGMLPRQAAEAFEIEPIARYVHIESTGRCEGVKTILGRPLTLTDIAAYYRVPVDYLTDGIGADPLGMPYDSRRMIALWVGTQGMSPRDVVAHTGIDRDTLAGWLATSEFVEMARLAREQSNAFAESCPLGTVGGLLAACSADWTSLEMLRQARAVALAESVVGGTSGWVDGSGTFDRDLLAAKMEVLRVANEVQRRAGIGISQTEQVGFRIIDAQPEAVRAIPASLAEEIERARGMLNTIDIAG